VLAQLPAMEPVIDVAAVSEVDRLKPPRGRLLVHHSRLVGYLAALGAVRSPEDSWLVRRRDYLEWLQEPLAGALFARDWEGLRGYAAVRVLEAQGRGSAGPRAPALLLAGRRRRLREMPVTPITQYQRAPDPRPGGGAQIRPSAIPGQYAQAGVVGLLAHRG
jgi:hypothetical protein